MQEKEILVVDDESSIRNLLEMALNRAGYSVCSVSCAEEALDVLRRKSFPLMFIDLCLGGLSGFDLCRYIRESDPHSIIYALTGNADLIAKAEFDEAGFDGCIAKPVGISTLYKIAKESFSRLDKVELS